MLEKSKCLETTGVLRLTEPRSTANHRSVFTLVHKFQLERGLEPASTSDRTTVSDISSATAVSMVKRPEGRAPAEAPILVPCDCTRLLDLMENLTLFSQHQAGLVKIIGQNHQFLGVNNPIPSIQAMRKRTAGL